MKFKIQPITEHTAEEISTWQYPQPYSIYNLSSEVIPILMNPTKRYFAVYEDLKDLVGYCCFGEEARVRGGEYARAEDLSLDVGVGMCPRLTNQGLGKSFIRAILGFAQKRYQPESFRVTVAAFNERSLRTFLSLGFEETHRFFRPGDQLAFLQFERDVFINQ